jgi:hypothetical protein
MFPPIDNDPVFKLNDGLFLLPLLSNAFNVKFLFTIKFEIEELKVVDCKLLGLDVPPIEMESQDIVPKPPIFAITLALDELFNLMSSFTINLIFVFTFKVALAPLNNKDLQLSLADTVTVFPF